MKVQGLASFLYFFLVISIVTHSFQWRYSEQKVYKSHISPLDLYPLHKFEGYQDLENSWNWHFHLLEEKDLTEAVDLCTGCFFQPKINLRKDGMTTFESILIGSLEKIVHSIDRLDQWINNYLGYKDRGGKRLKQPSLDQSRDAVIIAATKTSEPSRIVGLVELSMEKPNGMLPSPFYFSLAPKFDPFIHDPYLSNLCVDKSERKRGLGRLLCLIVERVAMQTYQKQSIYLHLLKQNAVAQKLYFSLGYSPLSVLSPKQLQQYRLEDILYCCKNITFSAE